MTDLMVWVLDPQKYADAAIHDRFLAPMATHRDVMLVVLNHIDEVPPAGRKAMLGDVRRLLEADGLAGVPVLATSARTGEGIDELRAAIANRVADKAATRTRLAGDVSSAAARLSAAERRRPAARARPEGQARPASRRSPRPPASRSSSTRSSAPPRPGAPGHRVAADGVALQASSPTRCDGCTSTGGPPGATSSPPPARRCRPPTTSSRRGSRPASATCATRPPKGSRSRGCAQSGAPRPRGSRTSATGSTGPSAPPTSASRARRRGGAASGSCSGCCSCRGGRRRLAGRAGGRGLPAAARAPAPRLAGAAGADRCCSSAGWCSASCWRWSRGCFVSAGARARARKADKRLRAAVAEVAEELVVTPVSTELAAHRATYEGLRAARG